MDVPAPDDEGLRRDGLQPDEGAAQPLLDAGAAWAETPRAVAEKADVVFAIVGFPKDVREVFLGPQGVLAGRGRAPRWLT